MAISASINRQDAQVLFDFAQAHDQDEFLFAADHGVYFCNINTEEFRPGYSRNPVIYVDGFDPDKNENWYEDKRAKFGGDDFGETIPVHWLELFLTHPAFKHKKRFGITLGAKSIKLNR